MEINTKQRLAIALSQLKGFNSPNAKLEQYIIESDIAAEVVWFAYYKSEIMGKVIADLGCGTGLLGLSALLLGAEKVFFVDIDEKSLEIAKENLKFLEEKYELELADKAVFVHKNIKDFDEIIDVVLQNPPFGIKDKHADKLFLEKAFKISKTIYSFHKAESQKFIDSVSKDNGFKATNYWEFDWPLKQTMSYHKKRIQYIRVGCWRLEKL